MSTRRLTLHLQWMSHRLKFSSFIYKNELKKKYHPIKSAMCDRCDKKDDCCDSGNAGFSVIMGNTAAIPVLDDGSAGATVPLTAVAAWSERATYGYNIGDQFGTGSGVWKVPSSGYWSVSATVPYILTAGGAAAATIAGTAKLQLVSGTTVLAGVVFLGSSANAVAHLSEFVLNTNLKLKQGDQLSLRILGDTDGAGNVPATVADMYLGRFSAEKIDSTSTRKTVHKF